ncbi:MAG TPA: hypothetical protein PKL83_01410 [bacterium]|nr:hypothetical protein [bacterium]
MDFESPAAALQHREQCLAYLWFLYQLPEDDPRRADESHGIAALEQQIADISEAYGTDLHSEACSLEKKAQYTNHRYRPASAPFLNTVQNRIDDTVLRDGIPRIDLASETHCIEYCHQVAQQICLQEEWQFIKPQVLVESAQNIFHANRPFLLFVAQNAHGDIFYVKVLIRLDTPSYKLWLTERAYLDMLPSVLARAKRPVPEIVTMHTHGILNERHPYVAMEEAPGKRCGWFYHGEGMDELDAVKLFNYIQAVADSDELQALVYDQREQAARYELPPKVDIAIQRLEALAEVAPSSFTDDFLLILKTILLRGKLAFESQQQQHKLHDACPMDAHGGNFHKSGNDLIGYDLEKAIVGDRQKAMQIVITANLNLGDFTTQFEQQILQEYQDNLNFLIILQTRVIEELIGQYIVFNNIISGDIANSSWEARVASEYKEWPNFFAERLKALPTIIQHWATIIPLPLESSLEK